jgi:MinD superfamily P-loop ATPase
MTDKATIPVFVINHQRCTLPMFLINQQRCTFCGGCAAVCPAFAVAIHDHDSRITEACTGCGTCAAFCPVAAIGPSDRAGREDPL